MSDEKLNSRRKFLAQSLQVAGGLAAGSAAANICAPSTAQQPLGPFFPDEGTPQKEIRESEMSPIYFANDNDLTIIRSKNGKQLAKAKGQIVTIKGVVNDKNCNPIEGAKVIIWQACTHGAYNHTGDQYNQKFRHPKTRELISRVLDPNFQYWGSHVTNARGEYSFKTVVPGFYPANLARGWFRPPHIHFLISAKGHRQFVTQSYFTGSVLKNVDFINELNKKDFLLQDSRLSKIEKENLVVEFKKSKSGHPEGIFNIHLPS